MALRWLRRGTCVADPAAMTAVGSTAGSLGSAATPMVSPARARSLATSRTPAAARATPASCAALGRSPAASPTRKGISALVALIGATMLIEPMARAVKKQEIATTLASPPSRTGHTACSPGHPWPARTITRVAPTRPTAWLPPITAQRLARRVVRPPRKSPEPQQIDCLLYTSDAADDLLCVDLG